MAYPGQDTSSFERERDKKIVEEDRKVKLKPKKKHKIIKTQKDFKKLYIKLSMNISEKKFNKIKDKFNRLGFNTEYLRFWEIAKNNAFYVHYASCMKRIQNQERECMTLIDKDEISIKDFLKEKTKEKMIKTKEDFKGLYIELPANISKKKFNKIKTKFKILGFNTGSLCYEDGIEYHKYIAYSLARSSIGNWSTHTNARKQISIKDFLKEEEKYYVIQVDNYNCIPNDYMVFYGKDLDKIKEDVDRAIQGFSYEKPIKIPLEEAIKKGLRFKFQGESWRKSPQGFILDSKGNSLKSSVLLSNINKKVQVINNGICN